MAKNNYDEYIRTIAAQQSISKAAESLGITQPAISAYLKKLESRLGTTLFDRNKQPLELTDAGKAYLDYLDKKDGLDRQLSQNIADIEELKTGHITIGGASFFNVAYLPQAIAAYSDKYPGVDIEIIDGKVPELTSRAHKGMLDLFITPVCDDKDNFIYEEFLTEKIYLAVPRQWEDFAAPEDKPLSAEDFAKLCERTFIVLKEDQHLGHVMNQLLQKYNCQPSHRVTAEQTMTTLALTQNGVGVSLITESSIKSGSYASLPKLYMADEELCTRKMYIAYPRNKYLSRATEQFVEVLIHSWK